ncbi:hypothetical protein LEP1GSC193_3249 [Leptospira alstonii serovar Pingchang str. 80-412]|uniref:Uncharacterized protein n=2 Tax=Leptospira alstonii TaxID=28452 RepID=M6D4K3_9LEPT|nr:hypothetical protein LEP1GSC194_3030 [Leptospira alstonii serovar Sichuan str. 79601]EQA79317.1 hypothetical protein LEP1GSC193_3249 [Leptospira alstonii serovar Pingchang str. 80-412]
MKRILSSIKKASQFRIYPKTYLIFFPACKKKVVGYKKFKTSRSISFNGNKAKNPCVRLCLN